MDICCETYVIFFYRGDLALQFDPARQGRLCIYELMAEESAVNYWEVRLP